MMIRTLSFDGKETEVLRFGKEGGEKLVILPGLSVRSVMGSADAIASAYSQLAEDRDIYLIERAKEVPESYGISDMAEDTLKTFELLGIEKADIMGVSMGGMIALCLALKDPEKVSSLVLCSSASRVDREYVPVFGEWKRLAENKDAKALGEAFGKAVYTPSFYEEYKEVIDASAEGAEEREFSSFSASIDAVLAFDVYEELSSIRCPVFVLGAGEDRVLGAKASRDMMEKLGCKGYIYEGRGHGVYDEAPDYRQRIKDFLENGKY
jgi:pimeloyl-ACP methyl ester carboxylesterase